MYIAMDRVGTQINKLNSRRDCMCNTRYRVVAQKTFYYNEVRKRCESNNIKDNIYFMLNMRQELRKFSTNID